MNVNIDWTAFRLLDLPPELIFLIVLWAQVIWDAESFTTHAHDPHDETRRHKANDWLLLVRSKTCAGWCDAKTVPGCLFGRHKIIRAVPQSPAHAMSQVGRKLRGILLGGGHRALWALDNTFYKDVVERPGFERTVGPWTEHNTRDIVVKYESRTLIAHNVCAHLMSGNMSFFPGLVNVRMGVPHNTINSLTENVEPAIRRRLNLAAATIQHLDLTLYPSPRTESFFYAEGIEFGQLLTVRCSNIEAFWYSRFTTSLVIHHHIGRFAVFRAELLDALQTCASTLEFLTLDVFTARFELFNRPPVALSHLRFLRLVGQELELFGLLRRLTLPAELDMHIEPVVNWRREHAGRAGPVAQLGEEEFEKRCLWRYAAAVAYPDKIAAIYDDEPFIEVTQADVWPRLSTVAVDIRLDLSTDPHEAPCSRFPEQVGVFITGSVQEMKTLLSSPGHDWRHCEAPAGKTSARRSLLVRDEAVKRRDRDPAYNPRIINPVDDVLRHVLGTVLGGRSHTSLLSMPVEPYGGLPQAHHLVIHPDSFIPTSSSGWSVILDEVPLIKSLIVLCPALPGEMTFTPHSEGHFAPQHLEALQAYLNAHDADGRYPCPSLERIELPLHSPAWEIQAAFRTRMESTLNSEARAMGVGSRITVAITD